MITAASAPPRLLGLDAVVQVRLPRHAEGSGELVVAEGLTHVPFAIARAFFVKAPDNGVRGRHAHKACSQFLICTSGVVEVICDDGAATSSFTLDRTDVGLLIPPSIWASQVYRGTGSVLTVLCDRPYEAGDYIRDYEQFKAYRAQSGQTAAAGGKS